MGSHLIFELLQSIPPNSFRPLVNSFKSDSMMLYVLFSPQLRMKMQLKGPRGEKDAIKVRGRMGQSEIVKRWANGQNSARRKLDERVAGGQI